MAVREGLLVLLTEGERYGYQLKTEWESATGGIWTVNVGQIYSTLDRLVRDGLVEVDERDDQKLYRLTLAGKSELDEWWRALPAAAPFERNGLVVKVLLALRAGTEHGLDIITRHRTALTASLQATRRSMRTRSVDADLTQTLLDDALITRIESDLRWLDQCERRLLVERGTTTKETP